MIKKPWQIWSLFALILCVVAPAMVWLTMQINQADQIRERDRVETELARRQAELQERINSALYRMDWWATPLVAQEAARPYYLYEPFYRVSAASGGWSQFNSESIADEVQKPSPLLYETSEFVVMHFQVGENNQISSPQRPIGVCSDQAISCGVTKDQLLSNDANLEQASLFCSFPEVIALCPSLPKVDESELSSEAGFQTVYHDPGFNRFSNPYGQINDLMNDIDERNQLALNQNRGGKGQKYQTQVDRSVLRGNAEYGQRAQTAEDNAQKQWAQNFANNKLNNEAVPVETGLVREGVMRPVWLNGHLILARRVEGQKTKLVQCCWLDWEKIKKKLQDEVADILPEVELAPITDLAELDFSRAMATLPIQMVVDAPKLMSALAIDSSPKIEDSPSGLKMSLWVAWLGLGVAAVASGLLLKGVLQLSERRAAFVSAVTHELRTPLTTFKMYSEMLAEKMVPPDKEQEYAKTMKVEADRLSNLVENVLQFARLEQGACEGRNERLAVSDLLGRFDHRLHRRAQKSNMDLMIQLNDAGKITLETDPGKVEQIIFNLVDNACKYAVSGTDRRIELSVTSKKQRLCIAVQDYGPGVSAKFRKRLFKPFCKSDQDAADSASGVGLGLALCHRMATSLGGKIYLGDSKTGARIVLEIPV